MEPNRREVEAGDTINGFHFNLPVDDATCRAQIASSLGRKLQEAVIRRRLAVVANGPSALGIDLRSIGTPTLALNGAIKLFTDQGLAPTYWAACDPQAIVADFLPAKPPEGTLYFVASKCHPNVFSRLRSKDIRIWHLRDHPADGCSRIALASSVTISASWLMHRRGFTDFEYWGWDGCFMDGRHHAVGDAFREPREDDLTLNYGGALQEDGTVLGGRNFPTTRTWAAEASGAHKFFSLARYFDIGIKIHGDGMIACAYETLMDPER